MMAFLGFLGLGLFIGAFGTMLGIGGGFLLMPVLLGLYPKQNPEVLTSISLAVVFFNALSGSVAYSRMKRIDYRSGLILAAAALPGAILGALSTQFVARRLFDAIIGVILLIAAALLIFKPKLNGNNVRGETKENWSVHLVDADNEKYHINFDLKKGILISLAAGYFSSILGIGGGIIHIPALVQVLNFPVHIATATSHFVLAIMAFTGTVTHALNGTLSEGVGRIIPLAAGVVVGAQVGARISQRLHGLVIMRILALLLLLVSLHTLWLAMK